MNKGFEFQIIGIVILTSFYAVYLGKMIRQRRQGIRTDQMARGKKERKLFYTELILKIATYSIVVVETVSIFMNTATPSFALKIIGTISGLAGVILFGIAIRTMRDSWRAGIPDTDRPELVVSGIFRFSRNPAFLAFDLVYLGILLLFFNWILLAFTVFAVIMLHLQILQEEKYLLSVFGEAYVRYKKQTGRYF